MPRRPRHCPANVPQHIISRGNNRQQIFANEADLGVYARLLDNYSKKHELQLHAWVFMSNHVHLLATPKTDTSVSRFMQEAGRDYVRYFNRTYQRTGALFEGRFKSCSVEAQRYFFACQRYIELNPVRANMVDEPGQYKWSSYRCHAFGIAAQMWTPHAEYLDLDEDLLARQAAYRRLFTPALPDPLEDSLRDCVNAGFAFGSDDFRAKIATQSNLPQQRLRRGPKKQTTAV